MDVPGSKEMIGGVPRDAVRTILDAQSFGVPDGSQVGLDRQLEQEVTLAIARILDLVLNDQSLLSVWTELKALDLQAVERGRISEPAAIGIGHEVRALREGDLLIGGSVRYLGSESVDQFDRVQPEPGHFAGHVFAHIREIAILRADQIRAVTGGDVGLLTVFPVVADSGHDWSRIVVLGDERRRLREEKPKGEQRHNGLHHASECLSVLSWRVARECRSGSGTTEGGLSLEAAFE